MIASTDFLNCVPGAPELYSCRLRVVVCLDLYLDINEYVETDHRAEQLAKSFLVNRGTGVAHCAFCFKEAGQLFQSLFSRR